MSIPTLVLEVAMIAWGIVCGASVYEHVAMVPVWAKAPPASLTMWQGEHRVRAERLWIPLHPVVVLLLALALGLHWSDDALRLRLGVVLACYVVVLVVTNALFIPELKRIAIMPTVQLTPDAWRRRARRWERWSLARGAVMLGLAVVLADALRLA